MLQVFHNSNNNVHISSKFKCPLSECKILLMALTRLDIQSNNYKVVLKASEIKRLLKNDANIYRTLKTITKSIEQHPVLTIKGKVVNIIKKAYYANGTLTLLFNDSVPLLEIRDFAINNFETLINMENSSSFKIYEYLKRIWINENGENIIEIPINLNKLRFLIGLANIQKLINKDWDESYLSLTKEDIEYPEWYDVQRYILNPAQKELEKDSDLIFTYSKKSKSSNIIYFTIYKNTYENKQKINTKNTINTINTKNTEDIIQKQVWLNLKKENEYFDFLFDLELKGIDTNNIENQYGKKELINMYTKWKNKK